MPESSDPRLDWSKLGEELAVVIGSPLTVPRTPTRDSLERAGRTGLEDAEASVRPTGSALPQMLLNLSLFHCNKKTKTNMKIMSTFYANGFDRRKVEYLRLSLKRTNRLLHGSRDSDKQGFSGGCCSL